MKVEISKKINVLSTNYSSLQIKVDTIVAAVTKVVECYQSLILKVEAKTSEDMVNFDKMGTMLGELKELVSKPAQTSLLTREFLTQKLQILDQAIQKAVTPISKFSNMLPTGAPPVVIGVQGGEKQKRVGKVSKANKGGKDKPKTFEKVVSTQVPMKVVSTQIPTPIVSKTTTVMATKTTTTPIQKGISIGTLIECGSSSSTKRKPTGSDRGKGKEIFIEKSKEEKKAEIEVEMEKQRQIQNIMRL